MTTAALLTPYLRVKGLLAWLVLCIACTSAPAAIVLRDAFDYPDGPLTNVSPGTWRNHAGVLGEVNVTAGQVELTRTESEDVNALLDGAPFVATSSRVLYSKFTVTVTALPSSSSGGYFAHFNAGSGTRGRVFITTTGAKSGRFRFGIANSASSASAVWPVDLNLNQPYTLMTRYALSNAQATLWIGPLSETNASIAAIDIPSSTNSISAFSWRQDSGIGTLLVDDLVVATSFTEALTGDQSPVISPVADQFAAQEQTLSIPFTVTDADSLPALLKVYAISSDSNLVRSITITNTESNFVATISAGWLPATNVISIFASDGVTTNCRSFTLSVLPALLFAEEFVYPDGPLIFTGAPTWARHGGGTGEVQVVSNSIVLATPLTEDVNTPIPGAPFGTNTGLSLYASMHVTFTQLPGSGGDYFTHFNTNGTRCRVFVNSSNAAPGKFRISIANASGGVPQQYPADLSLNTNYLLVLRYNLATATSTLWINPAAETDLSTNGIDVAEPSLIHTFCFRESSNMGRFVVDDVKVGLTFAAVAGLTNAGPPRLRIESAGFGTVRLRWPAGPSTMRLQWCSDMGWGWWFDILEPPILVGSEWVVTEFVGDEIRFFRLVP